VFARDPRHYAAVKRQLTPERLKEAFGGLVKGLIRGSSIDHLCALNFVMEQALEGGVNESLNLDSHGKSWSFLPAPAHARFSSGPHLVVGPRALRRTDQPCRIFRPLVETALIVVEVVEPGDNVGVTDAVHRVVVGFRWAARCNVMLDRCVMLARSHARDRSTEM
jgi:hypothetical protein